MLLQGRSTDTDVGSQDQTEVHGQLESLRSKPAIRLLQSKIDKYVTGELMTHITTEPRYLAHEGGTKFYEVIEFWNPDDKKFVMVKRWGKVGTAGETMVEEFNVMRACNAAAEKILKAKMSRGYQRDSSTEGFHGRGRSFAERELMPALDTHYRSIALTRKVIDMLNLSKIRGMEADMMIVDELSDIVVEEPGPEPDRGESWASW
jgi:predicted DNA-binding WGR domain protein